ncbi:MAG TPA: glycerol acyltransferase [Herpetosiphon sp.]|uniref:Phospholipid/glycerol acyltransferase n=1 Tax=Herpetosiphon aurantiacus (strain ATCC 23779 / DSM 785 / 114-95) TaxID=316274 RepID=A9AWT5_HERA2|nr:lysophospholipid acyltransferase family protein [Herpetosiphon sp.]ABX03336.1 phospholipid/glycerol acyltransferase [Herpetosiphon aurantiacus DSM 785]HBW50491.1 glycerol acyltransferase [Herpetosiphon sp.]
MPPSPSKNQPRLPAQPNRLGAWLVYRALIRPALRKTFDQVLLNVGSTADILRNREPILAYVTHTSWWDGHLAFELFRTVYPRHHYLMMEEAQLARYFFFRWCGCFSVNRQEPREALRSIRYASSLLQQKQSLVWIFPQGQIIPPDRRPLQLFRGVADIATRTGNLWCLPIALRYEFAGEQRPVALIRCGEPTWVDADTTREQLQPQLATNLTRAADQLRDDWNQQNLAQFRPILQGTASVNRRFDQILGPIVRWWQQ